MWETLVDPWSHSIMVRALLEVALIGVVGGAARMLDRVLRALLQRGVARARALPRPRPRRSPASRSWSEGGRSDRRRAGDRARGAGAGDRLDTGVAVVITTLFGAGALLALSRASPPGIQELMFGDVLGVTDLDLVLAGALRGRRLVVLRLLHTRLLVVGFDRTNASMFGADH